MLPGMSVWCKINLETRDNMLKTFTFEAKGHLDD